MSKCIIDIFGDKVWYDTISYNHQDGMMWYRILMQNNVIFWVICHREDGPAVIMENGSERYAINGLWHREDGPAIIWYNGEIEWFLNAIRYSFEEWCEKLNKDDSEINFLRLKWNIDE